MLNNNIEIPVINKSYGYLNQLTGWLAANGWAGWDPYDVLDNRIGMWMGRRENIVQRVVNALMARAQRICPLMLRRALMARPQINGKAMGLFAAGFLQLESVESKPQLIDNQPGYIPCFQWLEENKVEKFGGCGWGYPFD